MPAECLLTVISSPIVEGSGVMMQLRVFCAWVAWILSIRERSMQGKINCFLLFLSDPHDYEMNYLFLSRQAFDAFMGRGWAVAVKGNQRDFNLFDGLAPFKFDYIVQADRVGYWNQQQGA